MSVLVATPTGSSNADGSELSPYNLDTALAKAQANDTLLLRGVFREHVLKLDKDDIAVAAHPDGATFDPDYQYPKPGTNAIIMKAPDGTIGHYGALCTITGQRVKLSGVRFLRSMGRGVSVNNTANVLLSDVLVDGSRNAGVHIDSATQVHCLRVRNYRAGSYYTARRDPSLYNWPVAFNVLRSSFVTIDTCESSHNAGEGVALGRDTTDSSIVDSIFADNMALNLYAHRCARCMILRNLVYSTRDDPAPGIVVNNEDNFPTSITVADLLIANNISFGNLQNYAVWGNETSGTVSQSISFLFNSSINARGWASDKTRAYMGMLLRAKGARKVRVMGNLFYQRTGPSIVFDAPPVESLFERNGWSVSSAAELPAPARGAGDVYGVQIANPDSASLDVANFAPLRPYAVGPIDGAPILDYRRMRRSLGTVGALDYLRVEPPVEEPTEEEPPVVEPTLDPPLQLVLNLPLSAELQSAMLKELSGKTLTLSLGGSTALQSYSERTFSFEWTTS